MLFPADLKYTKEHAWVRVEGAEALVGITDHAQKELGDIVFVETPKAARRCRSSSPSAWSSRSSPCRTSTRRSAAP